MLLAVNGRDVAVPASCPPSTKLIEVIRRETNFTSVKLACGEGGCGACTVLLDRYNPKSGVVSRCSLNACLACIGSCDGVSVTTAEGIGSTKKGLHPAQEALSKRFASQCGFCTPGIAVAMAAAAATTGGQTAAAPGRDHAAAIARGLDGNLCRCTGLRPIIDACKDVADLEDLHQPRGSISCSSSCTHASHHLPSPADTFPNWLRQYVIDKHTRSSAQAANTQAAAAPPAGANDRETPAAARSAPQNWLRPQTLDEVRSILAQPSAGGSRVQLVAGNTGAGIYPDLWPHAPVVLDLSALQQLKQVQPQADGILFGAAVTIQELIRVLRQPPTAATQHVWGSMANHLERIAGAHVRSAATLGGHFGLLHSKHLPTDLALVLAAADAKLQVLTVASAAASKDSTAAAAAAANVLDSQPQIDQQQQQQLQDDGARDLSWVSVEAYLAGSCVGSKDAMHGATAELGAVRETARRDGSYTVVTAVFLPFSDDRCHQFWSYKLALRQFNSHALVNAAVMLKFDQSTVIPRRQQQQQEDGGSGDLDADGSSSSSSSLLAGKIAAQADPRFAGAAVASARVFVGLPSNADKMAHLHGATAAPAAAAAAGMESWLVLRQVDVEASLQGTPLTVKGLVSALRQLDSNLSSAGVSPDSFQAQALQGMLLKALVPLIDPGSIAADFGTTRSAQTEQNKAAAAAAAAALDPLLRLLQLPASYDADTLPEGQQVLPGLMASRQTPAGRATAAAESVGGAESAESSPAASASTAPVHLPIEKDAVQLQTTGEAIFTGDVAARMNGRLLYLAAVMSTRALATVEGLETSAALALPGVAGVITAADIPAANVVFDAPLLAGNAAAAAVCCDVDSLVQYVGQPIALVAATSQSTAERAASLVKVNYGQTPGGQTPVLTIEQAVEAESFHSNMMLMGVAAARAQAFTAKPPVHGHSQPPGQDDSQSNSQAMVDQIIAAAPHQIRGATYSLPAQQHMYMETQVAVAEPIEGGAIKIVSSTQSTDLVQGAVAAVLGLPYHKVTVVTKRLGGAFGGKATRSMAVAAAAALAAAHFGSAVCYNPSRRDDMQQNQGRCAGRVTYDVGFQADGKVLAVKGQVIYRAGAYLDLAFIDGMSMVAASDSAYNLSGLSLDVKFAKCNLPPHTIVRGPGFLQSVMMMEQVFEHVAAELAMDSAAVKELNFLPILADTVNTGAATTTSSSSSSAGTAAAAATALDSFAAATPSETADLLATPNSNGSNSSGAQPLSAGQAQNPGDLRPLPGSSSSSKTQPHDEDEHAPTSIADEAVSRHATHGGSSRAGQLVTEGRQCIGSAEVLRQHVADAQQKLSHADKHQQQQQQELAPAGADGTGAAVDAAAAASLSWPGAAAFADTVMAEAAANPCKTAVQATPEAAPATNVAGKQAAEKYEASSGVTTVLGRHIASEYYTLPRVWKELLDSSAYKARLAAVRQYNLDHAWAKRGIVVTPVRFDCSPTAVSAAVSVYADGSVLVTHGGVEMGQGLSTKVKQAAVAALSQLLPEQQRPLPLSLVQLAASSSDVVPNGGPTWSSTGSESNCAAVMAAAAQLVDKLRPCIQLGQDALSTWQATVASVFPMPGITPSAAMLSAYGYFDGTATMAGITTTTTTTTTTSSSSSSSRGGTPQQPPESVKYNAFGAAVSEVELDVLTGERQVLSSHIMYDCGRSLNPGIDMGQIEGAFVMGLGVMLSEDVVFDESSGELLTAGTWGYKIPTQDLIAQKFAVSFLSNAPNPRGVLSSKASGEPAIMTSVSALLALQQAAAAAVLEVKQLSGKQHTSSFSTGKLADTSVPVETGAASSADDSGRGLGSSSSSSRPSWCAVTAPATPHKLKAAVGTFKIADALEAACEALG